MLSTTNTAPVLHHTNEFSVPKAIRSASSPSGSFPTVQHARVTSLDLDPRPASGSSSASASASASVSQLYPRSSILINSRKRRYSGVIYADSTVLAGAAASSAAPVVTHIPAVPSRKEREKERERAREREKERERERERAKSKDDEKIWGIPKKALLLGLGDLNFNAQMAMMAGWGHGSGGASILPSTAIPTTNDRKRLRPSASAELPRSSSSSSRRSARHSDSDSEDDDDDDNDTGKRSSSSRHASRSASDGAAHDSSSKSQGGVSTSPTDEPMDPEELAALNAIINTRRSMAAAQALVSGSLSLGPRALRASTSFGSSAHDLSRPPLEEKRFESQDSVPSMSSIGHSSLSIGSSSNAPPTSTSEKALQLPITNANASSSSANSATTTTLDAAESKSARIRFAPLPTPTSAPAMLGRGSESLNGEALLEDSDESDLTDSDYDSDDDAKAMKGKWYLMGMPSAYFKPQYYTGKSSKRRVSKSNAASDGGGDDRSEDGNSSLRRKSTGSLSDGLGPDVADEEERGRGGASGSKVKRKSSQSRRRSRSRTGAISSGDEDERARRRELIRLARPGGTGMVTLPDGTKIRARRVNDQPSQDEPEFIEWGFAGLAREASRRSLGGGSGPPSLATTPNGSEYKGLSAYMEAEEEEEDDGSGMAWVRRRRREREAKARMEREQAEKAATEAAQEALQPAPQESASAEPNVQDSAASVIAIDGIPTTAATAAPQATTASVPVSTTTLGDSDTPMMKEAAASSALDEPMPLSSSDATAQPETVAVAAMPEKAKRQSQLSILDTTRPINGGMFADAGAMVASPTAEELPSAGLDASMLSETSNGEPASMAGSQILSRPSRAAAPESSGVPGDSTPRQNTGLGLTADKAEEIRRRHEDEVAALGAEVLAQTRRNNQRRQASSSSRGVATPQLGGEESAGEQPHHHQNSLGKGSSTSPTSPSSSTMQADASRESGNSGKKSISRAVGSIMRKATTDSEKTVRQSGPTPLKQEVVFPQMAEPAEGKHSSEVSQTSTAATAAAAAAAATVSQKHKRDASSARSPSPESTLSRQSSAVDGYTASVASKSASSLHTVGSLHAASSPMSAKRLMLDPSVSTPVPSPWLPRRPDARGVAVVPLPQLGVRPERPREGRVWQYDDSDASDAGKDDDLVRERREEEEEEEEGSDLDAEELLEEERKTAMQKKRATTRAAGQEVVHARLGKKASARALSDLTASYDDMAIGGGGGGASSSTSRLRGERKSRRRSSMDPRMPSAPRKAPPKLVRSRRSLQSMQAGEGGEGQEEEDEQDLWPAVSATSKSGTPRPRHILVNLPGGPGIWDSKTGGGRNAVAAINSVAAARAKAIKKRARDHRTSFELPPDWDDEMMDYGWPRSLKGSLY
ncbi:conserved hypothetical protein [Sporisorium reilianum SRZ2]|uniref:Uncharacterized protein n=1 Tax=Sporisorium reilianum (strain SRZ2) TaxID=999809 RepID=E7A3D8_SPORE|nr:conserved hypothetical protein [Sporisorium reilianum SRZ2]